MKRISVLGSTGSVGKNTLEVAALHPDRLAVEAIAAGSKVELLVEQARRFRPRLAAIRDERLYGALKEGLAGTGVAAAAGPSGILEAALVPEVDMVVGAVVGGAGLLPVYRALQAGKHLALANKETLVMAGCLMKAAAARSGARILPVDSEHNALYQCMNGEDPRSVRRLILTASGGPFRLASKAEMDVATVERALAHPTWKMGPKITIDSATLMNKGFEVIEAHLLFDLPGSAIEIVIHPKSIVHSMVEFVDGSILAQLGTADMKIPIRYALSHPERWDGGEALRIDLTSLGALEFFPPDRERFPCIDLAYRTLDLPSSSRIALNAANEVAVAAFLAEKIPFGALFAILRETVDRDQGREPADIDEVLHLDARSRSLAETLVASRGYFAGASR